MSAVAKLFFTKEFDLDSTEFFVDDDGNVKHRDVEKDEDENTEVNTLGFSLSPEYMKEYELSQKEEKDNE